MAVQRSPKEQYLDRSRDIPSTTAAAQQLPESVSKREMMSIFTGRAF
jgi:hypothetical protein